MIARELINQMVPPLKPSDNAYKALTWMEEFRCNYLPVVEQGTLLGFISDKMIIESNAIDLEVREFNLMGQESIVPEQAHFLDVLKVAGKENLEMVGVRDDHNTYVGLITVTDITTSFAQSVSVQMEGSILVLSLDMVNYSLAEICRFVEENNAKVISSTLIQDPLDKDKIKVTLKINTEDLSRIVATLERFNYRIIGRYQEQKFDQDGKEKLDALFKYLDL